MDNLPQPMPGGAVPVNNAVAQPSIPSPAMAAVSQSDPKLLEADAVEQIEAAVLQTTTSPAERALQIHAIKTAYLKARYNIETKGTV